MIDQNINNHPLDLSYLREMSGDSPEFMVEMLEVFQKQTPIYMADLENAIAAEDWKATSEFSHKIKPTFHYVGRDDLRELMQTIERNSRDLTELAKIPEDFAISKKWVARLYEQLEEAKVELLK
ncbi:Hpt domain-containing protein [Pedobacter insulae]|uniref:HPt (Histidine-containing phosphotransfer) domain-containing protein n=1 Tax=Pedobacter insulae TaxID=414048 RepID=A0A1I3A985_9SPHI|nr:Hpt domain-containing protein [Pedobacter insulae]SFH46673.1 HPt (histidine-containing phosphotransfer) domain-containing protein [Pedobacter insulae]